MNFKHIFAAVGAIMTLSEAIVGIYFYFVHLIINFLYLGIGLLALGVIIFIILIKIDYDPFQEFSCWALILAIAFTTLAFGYFPWDLTSFYAPMGLYTAFVCFSWAIYLTGWNIYALVRKKELDEPTG